MISGERLLAQADVLAGFSEDPTCVTRTYLTPQARQAGDYVIGLMRDAGMQAAFDALGNVVGRYDGDRPDAPVVMIGSHLDSVRNAGRYDGIFGVLSPIAAVAELHATGRRLPVAIEVVGFGDEEGVRFGVTLIGSKAMAGAFDPAWLARADADGVTMRDALLRFGADPDAWPSLDRRGRLAAYLESHIEQGPVLLNEGLALGVVSAIAGAVRARIEVTGLAGHAGTVPMGARQDALAAAAEMVLAVERLCGGQADLVGTVGRIGVAPGAINVIPQDVEFTYDIRSGDDAVRDAAVAEVEAAFAAIAARRNVQVRVVRIFSAGAAPCAESVQRLFRDAIAARALPVRTLPSGAGHDAMCFPPVCPTGMLFVRCGNGGISHHPDETMTAADAQLATEVLLDALSRLDPAAL